MLKVIIHREKQIKAARYHFTPTGTAKVKKDRQYMSVSGYGETGPLLYCWWDSKYESDG